MKKTIYLFFVCSIAYGQNIWKDIAYASQKSDNVYQLLEIEDKESLIIKFFIDCDGCLHNEYYYLVKMQKNAFIAKVFYTDYDFGMAFLAKRELFEKDFLKKVNVKDFEINKLIKLIVKKGFLKEIVQKDLDRPYIQDEQGKYIYSPMAPSHSGNYSIEFYQGNKYYKLHALSPEYDNDRSREKLNQFIELYKLLEATWSKSNSSTSGNL